MKKFFVIIFFLFVAGITYFFVNQKEDSEVALNSAQQNLQKNVKNEKKVNSEEVSSVTDSQSDVLVPETEYTLEQKKEISQIEEKGWNVKVYKQSDGKYRINMKAKIDDKYKGLVNETLMSQKDWQEFSEDLIKDVNESIADESQPQDFSAEERAFIEAWEKSHQKSADN